MSSRLSLYVLKDSHSGYYFLDIILSGFKFPSSAVIGSETEDLDQPVCGKKQITIVEPDRGYQL